jgi:hypothetical protein
MSTADIPYGSPPSDDPSDFDPFGSPPSGAANTAVPAPVLPLQSVNYLSNTLEEAELLLSYAAEVGIEVKDKIRADVLKARMESVRGTMSAQTAADLLTAMTALAVDVRPVTVRSLRFSADTNKNSKDEIRNTIRIYGILSICFAIPIVLFSLGAFIFDHFADQIKAETTTANGLALKLQAELGPASTNDIGLSNTWSGTNPPTANQIWWGTNEPPHNLDNKDIINDLREFAATMREIDEYAKVLNYFVFNTARIPYANLRTNREALKEKFELTPGLKARFSWEFANKIEVYQEVRAFGDTVQESGSVYYGALATCILPVLYALLGASAYLLRLYEEQVKNRSYVSGDRHVAHFMIAGISGLVVGLFNNVTQGVTVSPFAAAFLVGYAVDVFFTFLEGLLQMFKRNPGNPPHQN